jgi:hypothetical protein
VFTHVLAGNIPDGEKNTLTFVVTGSVLMRLPEVAQGDGAVNSRNDLGESDIGWSLREHVSATNASFGAHETGTFEG